ncbi:TIGR02466 family protein [Pseudoruegeria sp. SHC-113]|uniref:TIGR02466 family protein n=1 Tax=Pseudoruegeria sp. SHC-113 TaxID=2855439 RepID=UPI0021BA7CA8|nr:TIGR02466 family protein [Pseudoruegeria sp. SHC-113]MCT8159748.1 hypothetical protein [Pseudoruegeria sp. SHC-113]
MHDPRSGTALIEDRHFATQVFSSQIPAQSCALLNAGLLFEIKTLFEADTRGLERSNLRALGGWHSAVDLQDNPAFAPLVEHVEGFAAAVSTHNGYSTRHRLAITSMWAIVNAPGSYNQSHLHPGSHWSGAYYVQAPEGSGRIQFTDPRAAAMMQPMHYEGERPDIARPQVSYEPVPGRMLLFPSWLMHSVAPNLALSKDGSAERVVISFNLSQRPL